MYTQCPECETTFKLGAEDLRRAKGKVRCGDCQTVFNALEYLAEDVAEADAETPLTSRWTDSTRNAPGDLDPEFDLDDDEDSGAILYIGRDEDVRTAPNDPPQYAVEAQPGRAGESADDQPHRSLVETTREAAEVNPDDAEDDTEDDDFDDTVWERIPGVGIGSEDPDDWQPEDDANYADAAELDAAGEDEEGAEEDADVIAAFDTAPAAEEDSEEMPIPGPDTADDLEFNVPEDKWNNFFGPLPNGQVASVWQPPVLEDEAETATASEPDSTDSSEVDPQTDAMLAGDASLNPAWRENADTDKPRSRAVLWVTGILFAAAVLAAQLVHYNRDALAASATYGEPVRQAYATLGIELYPAWPINAYEIRGSEAVAGETGPDILDIRAQFAVTGKRPVGMPRLRVVLRDRWSNPVAAQDFGPREYAPNLKLPADGLLQPGVVISAHVSIQDPDSGAQGFELELCLPRRHTGLECSGQPFK